ncbi:hypothetical protein PhCBS80983_g00555 [Powellomyces hirtus]|uniref:Uncharacterized protein n=1 Tax=Powellomyces hirtus TaxID=109895 RepID=A0A507EDQ9_9FUNG|nr:hypothetical protein PhCBS80983_g00555 [Powellomyces hirtus]
MYDAPGPYGGYRPNSPVHMEADYASHTYGDLNQPFNHNPAGAQYQESASHAYGDLSSAGTHQQESAFHTYGDVDHRSNPNSVGSHHQDLASHTYGDMDHSSNYNSTGTHQQASSESVKTLGEGAFHGPKSGSATSILTTIRGMSSPGGKTSSSINYIPLEDGKEKDQERGFSHPMDVVSKKPRNQRTCLGVGGFYLFPRIPDVDVSTPYFPALSEAAAFKTDPATAAWTPGLAHTGDIRTATATNPFVLSIGVGVNVTVNSDNYVGYIVNRLTVSALLKDTTGKVIDPASLSNQLDASSEVNRIRIVPRSQTIIRLPVSINYTMVNRLSLVNVLKDPVLSVLAQACGIPGIQEKVPGTRIRMEVSTVIDLRVISWTGYKPKIVKDVDFACPSTVADALGPLFAGGVDNIADALLRGASTLPSPSAASAESASDEPFAEVVDDDND